ncbi:MAG: serine--tRNA ligase [Alphaproteobacteria bacterium]
MLDMNWIRENPESLDSNLARRGQPPLAERVLAMDTERRATQTSLQEMLARRNEASKEIGRAMGAGHREKAEALKAEVSELKERIQDEEEKDRRLAEELRALLSGVPNVLADDVPDGADENANVVLRTWGDRRSFDYAPKEHFELGEQLGLMDFETAARMSGARFVVLKGPLARLERALAQFMMDVHTGEFGYTEVSPPLLVRDAALFGTGQLPKFGEDLFRTTDDLWLIPTAEVPLTNMVRDRILDTADLPLRFVAWTCCYRSEAGAAGKDTRGMLRQHQFYKVELVSIVHPDASEEEQERMTSCAEAILQRLGLPHRVVVLCSGDTGFSMRRTFDVEVWLPGQGVYREISSCSTAGDFQARRMGARFRETGRKGTRFVHTLNGSGVAIGRSVVAILENNQQADGSVVVPEVLRPYMAGIEVIGTDE